MAEGNGSDLEASLPTQRIARPNRRRIDAPPRTVILVEQDGDVMYWVCAGPKGVLEVIANLSIEGATATVRQLHIDGPGPLTVGMAELRAFAQLVGQMLDVRTMIILGGLRTTGAHPGRIPRRITIRVR